MTEDHKESLQVVVHPTTSSMILKALYWPDRVPKTRYQHTKHSGDIPKEVIIEIARIKQHKSRAEKFKGCVKEVLGTCRSVGNVTVDGNRIEDCMKQVDDGEWDNLFTL